MFENFLNFLYTELKKYSESRITSLFSYKIGLNSLLGKLQSLKLLKIHYNKDQNHGKLISFVHYLFSVKLKSLQFTQNVGVGKFFIMYKQVLYVWTDI